MCKRAAFGVMLCMLVAPALSAQQRNAVEQRALIDSLLPELAAARRAVLHADSIERVRQIIEATDPLDTVAVAPFTIIAPRGQMQETAALFRTAVARAPELFSGLPRDSRFLIAVERQRSPHRGLQALARKNGIRMIGLYGATPSRRQQSADAAAADALLPLMPAAVAGWLQDQHWSRGATDPVFRYLATSPSRYAAGCHRSDMTACAHALGLSASTDSLFGYTPQQIRQLAADRISRNEHAGYYRSCVEAQDTVSCLNFLQRSGGLPPAVPPAGRASFLMQVLARGGPGAFARLIAEEHTHAPDAIAAAGNASLPVLIAEWRKSIEDNREISYAELPKGVLAALLWSGIAAVMAMQSTRRRAE